MKIFYHSILISAYFISVICSFECVAQIRNINISNLILQKKDKKSSESVPVVSPIPEDTLYAISIKKQHGWLLPLQTVNKNDIKKHSEYFRFTLRNSMGNWCRVEKFSKQGNHIGVDFNPYILNLGVDSLANIKWINKIKTASRIDFISDPIGKNVIQERAYSSRGRLMYSFSISPLNSDGNVFVGSCRDEYGLPAEMRNDKDFSYGTLIYLERDKWGNDSIVKFMDSKGYVKPNSTGVYCEQFIYDEFGRLLRRQSMDSNDELVNNNLDYCGIEYQYDNRNNKIKATYMDADWTPICINKDKGISSYLYKYDNLNRLIEIQHVDENDILIDECPGEYYDYSSLENKDLAKYYATKVIEFIENWDSLSDKECDIPFDLGNKDNVKITKINDNSYKSVTYSANGKIINITYYDADGNVDSQKSVPVEEYLYDVSRDERPFDNQYLSDLVNITIKKDFKGNIKEILCENSDGSYRIEALYNNGYLTEISGTASKNLKEVRIDGLNAYGHLSRCGGASWMRTYHLNAAQTLSGKYSCYFGTDEFEEPNYVDTPEGAIYCYRVKSNKFLDENNNPIDDFNAFRDKCPKYLSIEVTDKKGYELGFGDNDIVLSINDYKINPLISNNDFLVQKSLMAVLTAGEKKKLRLFHIDPASLHTSVKTVVIDEGNIEDYGIRLHCMYATSRQHERVATASQEAEDSLFYGKIMSSENKVMVISKSAFRDHSPYTMQNGRDGILLAAQINDFPLINWKHGGDEEKIEKIISFRNKINDCGDSIPAITLYITDDGKSIKTISTNDLDIGCSFYHANLDDENHLKMIKLSETITFTTQVDNLYSIKNYKGLDDDSKDKIYKYADIYHNAGFDDISFDIYKKLTKSGYSKALPELAKYYAYGWGVKKDLNHAEKIALMANDSGYSLCYITESFIDENQNARIISRLKNIKEDEYFFDMAQKYIGDAYLHNDTSLALEYYFKALNNANSISRYNETHPLINKIRKIDSSPLIMDSIYSVAIKLFDDDKDREAYSIFKALVDCEYYEALHYLSVLTLYGYGVDQDVELATSLANTLFEKENNAWGIFNVAKYHIRKNEYNKAVKLLIPISKKGYCKVSANYYLGKIYSNPNYFENNIHKSLQYTIEALSYTDFYDRFKDDLPEVKDFLLSNKTNHPIVTEGIYYISLHYLNHGINDKCLNLLRQIKDIDPNFAEENSVSYYIAYYRAMHANSIPSSEEYKKFMENKVLTLYVPHDLEENNGLFKFKGQKLPIVSLNGWNNSPECMMNNIFDYIYDENVITVEIGSQLVEVSLPNLLREDIYLEPVK